MHFVLIETSGNQGYIFATNKMRENVGASDLTYRAGTQWVLNAVKQVAGVDLWDESPAALRSIISGGKQSPRINQGADLEIVMLASGKAELLVQDIEAAREIITQLTSKALAEAPGMEICGIISEPFDWASDSIADIVRDTYTRFELVRSRLPGPDMRHLRLPFVAECQTSGLPASELIPGPSAKRDETSAPEDQKGEPIPVSMMSLKKICAQKTAQKRLGLICPDKQFAYGLEDIDADWLAVVHADGNGVGSLLRNLDRHADLDGLGSALERNQRYVDIRA